MPPFHQMAALPAGTRSPGQHLPNVDTLRESPAESPLGLTVLEADRRFSAGLAERLDPGNEKGLLLHGIEGAGLADMEIDGAPGASAGAVPVEGVRGKGRDTGPPEEERSSHPEMWSQACRRCNHECSAQECELVSIHAVLNHGLTPP